MHTLIIGVDPGQNGAIAAITGNRLVHVEDMPTDQATIDGKTRHIVNGGDISNLYRTLCNAYCPGRTTPTVVIERVWSSPGQGVASAFGFGRSYEAALTAALTLGYTVVTPPSATWKVQIGVTSDKDTSLKMARNLWPKSDAFKRKKDADRAEAALIAEWFRRTSYDGAAA